MRVLVTGAAGFIGSSLASYIVGKGHQVLGVDMYIPGTGACRSRSVRKDTGFEIIDSNISCLPDDLLNSIDFVYNCAGITSHKNSISNPSLDVQLNLSDHVKFYESISRINPSIGVLHLSTRQVYGTPSSLPVKEHHPVDLVDVNAVSKYANEQILRVLGATGGIRSLSARLTNVYGPGMSLNPEVSGFVGAWIGDAIHNGKISIMGDGSLLRDFIYIDDLCEILYELSCYVSSSSTAVNVSSGTYHSQREIAAIIGQIVGQYRQVEVVHVELPTVMKKIAVADSYLDIKYLQERVAKRHFTDITSGLKQTVLNVIRGE